MTAANAPIEIVRNPKCEICNGTVVVQTSAEEYAKRRSSKGPVDRHVVEEFVLSEPRYPNWCLELYLHGRRDITDVEYFWIRLEGTAYYPQTDNEPAGIWSAQSPYGGDFTHILGVHMEAEDARTFIPNAVKVGGFLSMKKGHNGVCGFQSRLPIIHIIASYTPYE